MDLGFGLDIKNPPIEVSKEELMRKRNDAMRTVRHTNKIGSHRNCVRISTANSLEHEIKKLQICYELIKEGKEVITEAIFDNGSRADILVLDDHRIIEILQSEEETDCVRKIEKYPDFFELEMVKVSSDKEANKQ